jgi:head-tail adaptor
MDIGSLNSNITIQTYSETISSGDVTGVWDAGVAVRANVKMVDGKRYLRDNELIDGALYKIILWDNNYSDNIRIVYGSLTLYPLRPITRNPGEGSFLNEITILATVKK